MHRSEEGKIKSEQGFYRVKKENSTADVSRSYTEVFGVLLSRIKNIQAGRLVAKDASPHTVFQGIPIYVENPKGSVRHWETDEGETGKTKMFHPYGYIKNTEGTDGDEIDCFIGPDKSASKVFVIFEKVTGEDKCMLGFVDQLHARDAFLAHYDDQKYLGEITEMTIEDFRQKIEKHKSGDRIK